MSSKSGSETTETTLPSWLQEPVQRNLQRAEDLQKLPFMPYRGAEIAAFNDNTIAAFNNNNDTARAFGFNAPTNAVGGMPEPTTYADGSKGYDSNSLYDQALLDSKAYDPVAWDKYQSLFNSSAPSATPNLGNNGNGGGGGGGNNAVDPNMLAIQKLRDDRAKGNTPTPMQKYLDDEQNYDSGYNNPSAMQKYMEEQSNFTPTPPPAQTYDTSGGNPFGYSDAPYQNQNLGARDIHSGSAMEQRMQNPIDEQIARYYEELKAGK